MSGKVFIVVKCCVVILLLAKGVLHFTADHPYHYIFGDSKLLVPVFGIVLILFGVLAIMPEYILRQRFIIWLFVIPSFILGVETLASYYKSGMLFEQIIEHSLQVTLPLFLVYIVLAKGHNLNRLYYLLAVAIGLTFIGHALYAIGIHYVPENFLRMTVQSFQISTAQALIFLRIMGWLDIVFTILIFVPVLRNYAIWYLIIWGLTTAFARTYYVLGDGLTLDLLLIGIPNTIYRIPHGLIPILMLLIVRSLNENKKDLSNAVNTTL